MELIIRNISLFIVSILVLFLSMGVSVSKMKCSENGELFLGKKVPNCIENKDVSCFLEEDASCCNKQVIEQSCCPETNDNTCAGETTNVQFDFETIISCYDFSCVFSPIECHLLESRFVLKRQLKYFLHDIPPPKLLKKYLSQIQSFLL